MENNKKLYKIEHGKKICGVCGGIAEYFGLDATIVRIAWALIMPDKSDVYPDIM